MNKDFIDWLEEKRQWHAQRADLGSASPEECAVFNFHAAEQRYLERVKTLVWLYEQEKSGGRTYEKDYK